MSRRRTHRIVIVIALAAALLAPASPLVAEPHGAVHASSWRLDLDALWTWTRLWLGCAKSDAGLHIDPNGTKNDAGARIRPQRRQERCRLTHRP